MVTRGIGTNPSPVTPSAPQPVIAPVPTAPTPSELPTVAPSDASSRADAATQAQARERARAADSTIAATLHLDGITPLPETRRSSLGPALFEAALAPGVGEHAFFGENEVPMTAMVLNAATINGGGLEPGHIARAALQANPDIRFLVPTQARFDSLADPRFKAEQQRISDRLGVPAENIIPVRSDMAAWPQDEFLAGAPAGELTLVRPGARGNSSSTFGLAPGQYSAAARDGREHWNNNQRTTFAASDLASEIGVQVGLSDAVARGGDTHIVTRPDGQQAAYFSAETVRHAAETRGIDATTEAGFLQGLDVTMRGLRDAGIPLESIAPLGRGDRTYRQALDALSPEQRSALDPQVIARFEELGDSPLPTRAYSYHTDLAYFTPDGRTMMVNEDIALLDPNLERQLQTFGFETARMPARTLTPDELVAQGASGMGKARVSYMNAVTGRDAEGKQVILMPTEAMDPSNLTARDVEARAALLAVMPEARIIPVGGRSALIGRENFSDGYRLERDWGMHCLSNVLPFLVTPRQDAPPR